MFCWYRYRNRILRCCNLSPNQFMFFLTVALCLILKLIYNYIYRRIANIKWDCVLITICVVVAFAHKQLQIPINQCFKLQHKSWILAYCTFITKPYCFINELQHIILYNPFYVIYKCLALLSNVMLTHTFLHCLAHFKQDQNSTASL